MMDRSRRSHLRCAEGRVNREPMDDRSALAPKENGGLCPILAYEARSIHSAMLDHCCQKLSYRTEATRGHLNMDSGNMMNKPTHNGRRTKECRVAVPGER